MNHFFREKISHNLTISNFRKWINYYQIQQFVYKSFVLENVFLLVSAIKEFIFKNQKRWSCGKSFLFQNSPSIIILLFLKAKLSIFAWGLLVDDENYLIETKYFWFKQNIFGPNKYLLESNKFLPSIKQFISLTIYHIELISLFWRKINLIQTNIYFV